MTESYDATRRRAVVGTLGLAGFAVLRPLAAAVGCGNPQQTEGPFFRPANPTSTTTT